MMRVSKLLRAEAKHYGILLRPEQIAKLDVYCSVLRHWNEKVNLMSVDDPLELVRFHVLESLYVNQFIPLEYKKQLDIGSGAGFPAIPMKIIREELSQTLLEARKKKAAFLKEVVRQANLSDVDVLNQRLEEFMTSRLSQMDFELVTMRAVHLTERLTSELLRHLKKDCLIISWHGKDSPFTEHLQKHKQIRERLLRALPYAKARYLHIFQKLE